MSTSRGISIRIDEASYNAVINGLKAITWKSEESVFSAAINKTAKKAQGWWGEEVAKVYVGDWPKGLVGRSTIRKSTTANVGATIDFKSGLPGLEKFQTAPLSTPTRFSRNPPLRYRRLAVGPKPGQYKTFLLGPQAKYTVTGRQRADEGTTTFSGSFMTWFGGHRALAWRKNGKAAKGEHHISGKGLHGRFPKRYPLGQAFGSSDRAMADNPDVHAAVDPKVEKFLNDEVAKALDRALVKAGAK